MRRNSNARFTLIETMVAVMVLAVGVLGLAAMLASSVARMNVSQDEYIAQQKAAEAVESIFTARNTGQRRGIRFRRWRFRFFNSEFSPTLI